MPTRSTSLDVLGVQPSDQATITQVVTTAAFLKDLSIRLAEIANTRDFSDPVLEHVSPKLVSHYDAGGESFSGVGKDAILAMVKSSLDHNPNFHTEVLDVQTNVNEVEGSATVWMLRLCTRVNDGLRREVAGGA